MIVTPQQWAAFPLPAATKDRMVAAGKVIVYGG